MVLGNKIDVDGGNSRVVRGERQGGSCAIGFKSSRATSFIRLWHTALMQILAVGSSASRQLRLRCWADAGAATSISPPAPEAAYDPFSCLNAQRKAKA